MKAHQNNVGEFTPKLGKTWRNKKLGWITLNENGYLSQQDINKLYILYAHMLWPKSNLLRTHEVHLHMLK